jgi:hypothetical protein
MWMLLSSLALGGYGDAIEGRPSHIEREVHFWTNMVRIDPSYFSEEYDCSFNSFSSGEKTPKWPLLWDHGLGEAARVHSADMNERNYFSHDTQGGPSFGQRVYSYYDGGAIGENIAYGYGSAWDAVIGGWMCSSGHRANIMSTNYDELGTGVDGTYYTQDFGDGNAPTRALAMGIHLPANPSGEVDLGVDWTLNEAPDALFVVLDGEAHDLEMFIGDPNGWSGWSTRLAIGTGCHEYYFVGEAGGVVQTFPEQGSYTFGGCTNDDPGAGWVSGQLDWVEDSPPDPGTTGDDDDDDPTGDDDDDGPTGDDDDDDPTEDAEEEEDFQIEPSKGGCSTAGVGGSTGLLALVLLGYRRRRG